MKRLRLAVPLLGLTLAASALAVASPGMAAPKAAPSASPSAAPAPSPTATPEPLDIAIPRLEAAVKKDPNDKAAATDLASDYLAVGRADLALGLTQKLLAGGTKTAQIYYLDGAANATVGRTKEAIASFEQAANLEPTNLAVLQSLTSIYLRENRAADAERVAKRALTFNKDSKDAFVNYGLVLAAEKKFDEARGQFEEAAKRDPKDAHPVVLEARTYVDSNAIALAQTLYDRAVAVDPTSTEALLGKAQLAGQEHNVKDSVATYEALLKLQTDDIDRAAVVAEIGKVYAREKMDTEADATFRRGIDSYPTVSSAHVVYGDYLASKNDKAGAQREWTAGLGTNRDNADALQRLGELSAQSNDIPKATEYFKRLTEVANNDPRAHLTLAGAYMAQKQYANARDEFKRSYSLQHSPEALVGLANADQQARNYKEAIQIYEAIDASAPALVKSNPGLLYNLGRAYQGNNDNGRAKVMYTRFLGYLKPGSPAYAEVQGLIAGINKSAKSASSTKPAKSVKPAPTATPKATSKQ